MDGDKQKLKPSKLKKNPIEILNNLKKQTNNYVEANKQDKPQNHGCRGYNVTRT
jgi:hypothetical protein